MLSLFAFMLPRVSLFQVRGRHALERKPRLDFRGGLLRGLLILASLYGVSTAAFGQLVPLSRISTVAGSGGTGGYTGDGGLAMQAELYNPSSAVEDSARNLYIADTLNQVVRKVTPEGIISTYAGNHTAGESGDGGPATAAELSYPVAVAVDAAGNLYISDTEGNTVRKVDAATQTITTVAGNGSQGSADAGLATQASLNSPQKIVLDGKGNLYVGDTKNNLVRKSDVGNPTLTFATPTAVGSTDTTDGPLGVVISNIGNAPLALPPPATGTNASVSAGFSLNTGESGACPVLSSSSSAGTLVQGSSCELEVNFTPVSVGRISGSLVLTDNSENATSPYATQTITLIGTGAGTLTIAPTTQTFSATAVGSTSPTVTSTISNSTSSAIYLSTGSLTDAEDFTQSDNCSGLVGSGSTCTVTFAFTPQITGPLTSTYSIHDLNDPGSPLTVVLSGTGNPAPVPQAVLSPTSLAFTALTNAAAGNQNITLSNPGNATLNISSVAIGGVNATSFTVASNNCGTALVAGGKCTIAIGFPAAAAGMYSATLTVTDNASPTTQTVSLSGTVTGSLTIAPVTQAFGATAVGSTGSPATSSITNRKGKTVNLSAGSLTNSTDFTASDNCNGSVASGSACTVTFAFKPQTAGALASTYSIQDVNNPGSLLTVTLSGTGTPAPAPQALLSPTSLAFTALANAAAGNQNITLSNPGNATLNISSVAIGGANAASFTVASNNCGTALVAGGKCTIAIGFPAAAAAGTYNATLTVTDNASPAAQTVSLSGTVNGIGQATLTPASIDFGNVTQGSTVSSQTFTLANTGTAYYTITSIGLTGTNAASFSITTNTCGGSLDIGKFCSIAVNFTPSATAPQSASLAVIDSVGTQTSSLSGVGIAPPPPPDFTLTATPAAQTSYLGRSVTYQLAVAPLVGTNPFNSAVTFTVSGLPAGATASFAPASVTPSAATASSVMTVTIPALSSDNRNIPANRHPTAPPIAFATLLLAFGLARIKRVRKQLSSVRMLLFIVFIGGLCAAITGCSGTGFAVPQTTSTITVTGASGTLTHTAAVTLTLK
jgi:hypothetical protein